MLDTLYDSYGYDESVIGMDTLATQGKLAFDAEYTKDIKYTEIGSFIRQDGDRYTDYRWPKCNCC